MRGGLRGHTLRGPPQPKNTPAAFLESDQARHIRSVARTCYRAELLPARPSSRHCPEGDLASALQRKRLNIPWTDIRSKNGPSQLGIGGKRDHVPGPEPYRVPRLHPVASSFLKYLPDNLRHYQLGTSSVLAQAARIPFSPQFEGAFPAPNQRMGRGAGG